MRLKPLWLALVFILALVPLPAGADQPPPAPSGDGLLSGPTEGDPVTIAIDYIRSRAADYGLSAADVSELTVTSSSTGKNNGVTYVNLNQQFQGLDVFGAHATVSVMTDGSILFVGGRFFPDLRIADDSADTGLPATDAVAAAADGLGLGEPAGLRVLSSSAGDATVSRGAIADTPIETRDGWQMTDDGLVLAHQVVIDEAEESHLWNTTVDAATGAVLDVEDWTDHDTMDGLVSALGRPAMAKYTAEFVFAGPPVITTPDPVDDGSSYRVYALRTESPNDGDRNLVDNPADASASPFGWHDTDGVAGPEYTVTRGNNVHAYTDRDANGDPDPGSDPDGGPGLDYDFPLDLTEHPQNYFAATTTNLFYWCNIAHDIFSIYGFDESNGNFQVNNYSGDGVGGDDVRCEAADGNGHNNANFSTPASDGGRPRMQMYLWPGNTGVFGLPNGVTIDTGAAAGTYGAQYARFTPAATNAGTSGNIVLADDGVDDPADGCTPYSVPAGSIVVVDNGGDCSNYTQVVTAEAAGAAAVIVADNFGSNPSTMSGSVDPAVGIPAVQVSTADGATIKAALPVAGSVHKNANHPGIRDGDLDAGIVMHEYGHGVSNRLTGGPGVNCLSGDERMGEGWSDYFGLALLLDPELDDPQGQRGLVPYALFEDSRAGDGLRPRPYSRNMNIQPFTYDMIKTNGWITGGSLSTPHGVGHGWAAVLWDMTWDLIDKHGFNPQVYEAGDTGGNTLAYQLVMDALKIQGCGPGFVVGRDAILAADVALTGGENQCDIWRSFARRGLGYSAIQGTTDRDDNDQAFDLHPDCNFRQTRIELLGENEPDGGDPDGSGGARVSWRQNGEVCFDIRVDDIATPTAAHIHSGGHGVNGPIVIDFDVPNNGLQGCVTGVDPALLLQIKASPSQYYVNVHNVVYPGGALRAQLD